MGRSDEWKFDTRVIHSGQTPEMWQGASLPPIYQTASHRYDTAQELSDVFAEKAPGYIYARVGNPTNDVLERKLADLEGGPGALVTSSGMAAITDTVMAIVSAGDEIVSGNSLFLSTHSLFVNVLPRFGVGTTLVETTDLDLYEKAITDKTRLIFVETIGNPKMDVPDIEGLACIAHRHSIPLVVDNTLATPYLFRPIEHGADIVVHSITKFFNGHGSALGGVIIDSGKFPWPLERYPHFELSKQERPEAPFLDRVWREEHMIFGTTLAPFHSFLTMTGLDTLALRMERHMSNSRALAEYLDGHKKVKWVNYPGLSSSPSHEVAKRQFAGQGYGALLTFGLADQDACFRFIDNVKLAYHLANLGDCKTLVLHPYSSQYVSFTEEKRAELSIPADMVRVSIGIEHPDDIIADFEQALAKA
ncbi:MAG: O-acetylhomoserine aminocarboxypropyltransferase/cysteine synthase [Candidatus Brocadiia bacterium]|nr:O-acetylhomoserine aminocarboxypropyltransferase/cysteine synthase [Candidatus Brocadiia bacterium]